MREFHEVEIPAQKKTQLEEVRCDFCKTEGFGVRHGTVEWAANHDIERTTISLEEGHTFPEGSGSATTHVDMCPRCFKEKLIPWLIEQGAEPQEIEKDW